MSKMFLCAVCAVVAMSLGAGIARAGNLTPPGAPASTMKTLNEVEARIPIGPLTTPGDANSTYRIAAPGSYYLTGNLTGEAGKHGILIASSDVALDLNGFTFAGVVGSLDGVRNSGGDVNLTVRNGTLQDWGGSGVDLFVVSSGEMSLIEHVQVRNVGLYGIRGGIAGRIIECSVTDSASQGIYAASQSVVENCTVRRAGSDGFLVGIRSIVRGCSAVESGLLGFTTGSSVTITDCLASNNSGGGFNLGTGSAISGSSATQNIGNGIIVISDAVVTGNLCDGNSSAGIRVTGSDCRVDGNQVTDSPIGVDIDSAGNMIARNSVSGCTTAFTIVANNSYGPIVDSSAPGGLAVSGASANGNLGSTNPWTNFVY